MGRRLGVILRRGLCSKPGEVAYLTMIFSGYSVSLVEDLEVSQLLSGRRVKELKLALNQGLHASIV